MDNLCWFLWREGIPGAMLAVFLIAISATVAIVAFVPIILPEGVSALLFIVIVSTAASLVTGIIKSIIGVMRQHRSSPG